MIRVSVAHSPGHSADPGLGGTIPLERPKASAVAIRFLYNVREGPSILQLCQIDAPEWN